MRPTKLRVENFTCFKDAQDVPLSGLDLFAITGPTGAGKTSVLDAMTLALYGEVPRVGDEYKKLISLGRDRLSVLLEFSIQDRAFRVTRVVHRRKASQAQLDEIVAGEAVPIIDGVREVNRRVVDILGLGFDAFTQAVVLPQNEFAKFLKSQPAERGEILRGLLRLGVYERMRGRAEERRRMLSSEVQGLETRLREEYSGCTAEALDEARKRAATLREERDGARVELQQRRLDLDTLRWLERLTEELHEKRRVLEDLALREEDVSVSRAQLEACQRAAGLLPLVEAAAEREEAARGASRELADATTNCERARREHLDLGKRLEVARESAKEVETLEGRIKKLGPLLPAYETARRRLREAKTRFAALESHADGARKVEQAARAELAKRQAEVTIAAGVLQEVPFDSARAERLEAVRDAATALRERRKKQLEMARHIKEAVRRASEKHAEAEQLAKAAANAKACLDTAKRTLEETDVALREAEHVHRAMKLREELRKNGPCPVCEQPVAVLPRVLEAPAMKLAKERFQKARTEEELARRAEGDRRVAAEGARSQAEEAEMTADGLERRGAEEARQLGEAEEELRKRAGDAVVVASQVHIEERILTACRQTAELRQRHERAKGRVDEAERLLDVARRNSDRAEQELKSIADRLQDAATQVRVEAEEVALLSKDLAELVGEADPVAEEKRLASRVKELKNVVDQAREDEVRAARDLKAAEDTVQAADHRTQRAAAAFAEARERAVAAMQVAGFSHADAVRAAVLLPEEQDRLARLVQEHRRSEDAARQRVVELETELAGRQVSREEVEALSRTVDALQETGDEATKRLAALEREIQELERRAAQAARLSQQLDSRSAEQAVYRQLAEDLRSDRFQAFLLEETFRELVRGASLRLRKLTNERYTFDFYDDDFHVLDHDNADERRSADTLSGGETFLASLALAMELSEQIQRAHGAVLLQSLFIDEGFGTLDAETLETVASAIEALPTAGRMVGIITHLADLSARLPARVILEKRPSGTTIHVEGV